MRLHFVATAITAISIASASLFAQVAPAKTGEIHVLASNGIKAVVDEVLPQAQHAVGHPFAMDFSTGASLKKKIEDGAAFDVAILQPEAIDDLIKQGKIVAGSRGLIARSGIGVGIRAGAAKPDITTPEAMKRTMLKAKSITYTGDGASRAAIDKMFERLGIAADLKPKINLTGPGQAPEIVAAGQAEFVITLISEILPVHGVELLGPLPADFQSYVSFAAGVGAHAADAKSADSLVKYLSGPAVMPTLKSKGMESLNK